MVLVCGNAGKGYEIKNYRPLADFQYGFRSSRVIVDRITRVFDFLLPLKLVIYERLSIIFGMLVIFSLLSSFLTHR